MKGDVYKNGRLVKMTTSAGIVCNIIFNVVVCEDDVIPYNIHPQVVVEVLVKLLLFQFGRTLTM